MLALKTGVHPDRLGRCQTLTSQRPHPAWSQSSIEDSLCVGTLWTRDFFVDTDTEKLNIMVEQATFIVKDWQISIPVLFSYYFYVVLEKNSVVLFLKIVPKANEIAFFSI